MSTKQRRTRAAAATEETKVEAPVAEETVAETPEVEAPVETTEEVLDTVQEEAPAVAAEVIDTVPEAPVAYEAPVAVTKEEPKVDNSVEKATEGNEQARYIALELEQYAQAMAPNHAISAQAGATWQVKLFRIIERTFNRVKAEDFQSCMDTLMAWFYANRETLTSDGYLFRFSPEWTATTDEYQAFTRFATLLKLTSDPKSRNLVLKDMNFEYYLAFGLTETGRERILAYFDK